MWPITSLLCIYGIWFCLTSHVRYLGRHWGYDRVARVLQICSDFIVTSLMGVELVIKMPEGAVFPYTGKGVVGAASPHGSFPLGQVGIGMARFRMEPELATLKLRSCAASILFYIPLLRELILMWGARDASRRNLLSLLEQGYSVGINPGGNYEMASASNTHEAIYCQRGLGFVRLAMAAGRPILPLYSFGENQLFVTSSAFLEARRWIARKVRIGVPIMFGRLGLPYGLPHPTVVTLVIGREIDVGSPNAAPTDAEVSTGSNQIRSLRAARLPVMLPPVLHTS